MYSQAFNNSTSLSGVPDPQTGTFSFKQRFGSIRSDAGFGPKFDFSMSFQALAWLEPKNVTGLGRGFSFNLGSYTSLAPAGEYGTIILNSGESYQVINGGVGVGPWKLTHKLKDIEIEQTTSDEITIKHKSGDIETLKSNAKCSSSKFFLAEYKSSTGRTLNFSYQYNQYGYQLTQIKETDKTVLATVEYENNSVSVTINPNSFTELKKYILKMSGNNLASIQLPDRSTVNLSYKYFSISNKSFPLLEKIVYPSGATEEISYGNQMYLPPGAPMEYLPALSNYKKRVSSEQTIQSTYTYNGQNNYWGYNSGAGWLPNNDSLLFLEKPYEYSSTVVCGVKTTTTTYNRFHQIKEIVETNGDVSCKSITTYEYNSNEDTDLDHQTNIYELPKSKGNKYETSTETSPEYKIQYKYDDYGNTTKKIEATGVTTINEYYSADGDNNCPRHPFGMVNFKKSETEQPIDSSPPKVKYFTFQNIIAVDGNQCIVPSGKTYNNCSTSYEYYSQATNAQCQIKSQTVTVNGKSSTKEFEYSLSTASLIITESFIGHDGIHSSISKTLSARSGLVLEERNRLNVSTKYTYDVMDRVLSLQSAPGTDYETNTYFTYSNKYGGGIGTLTTQKNCDGVRTEIFYNGVGQELYQLEQDTFGNMQKTKQTTYDDQGRLLSSTKFDYSFNSEGKIDKTYTDIITNVYGYWGEPKEVRHNTGVCELQTLDPIKMTKTSQIIQLNSKGESVAQQGPVMTKNNLFGHKDKVDVLNLAGEVYSTTQYKYDGFGRSISTTTPLNATASVNTYDDFDRPIETTHFDGTMFRLGFVDFSSKRRITSVNLVSSGFILGEQDYDSLLRCTSRTTNGVKTQYSYHDARNKPSAKFNSRGQTVLFDYFDELGSQISRSATFTSQVQSGDWNNSSKVSENTFSYAKSSDHSAPIGRIISSSSTTGTKDITHYTNLGYIESTTQTIGNFTKTVNHTKMSLKGRMLSYNIGERQVSISYDEYGRIVGTTDGNYAVETTFGNFDLVSNETVKKDGIVLQTTTIVYDEYGQETTRTISCGKTIVIESGYDIENKLINRTTTIDSASLSESFTYDERRHLITYTASSDTNELLPRNENNKPINSQSFAYDEVDNITSITTGFPNGDSDTATYVYDSTNKFTVDQINHTLTTGDNAYPATETQFTYDADGNLLSINDTTMTYTVSGRVSSKNGTNYIYDSYDRLVQTDQTAHFYSGSSVVQEGNGSSITDFIHHGANPAIQVTDGQYSIFGLNRNASVVSVKNNESIITTTYSPFGVGDNSARIGYKGELKDISDSNCYPLGFGTRFFLPSIGRFSALDSFSPFSSGELNPYCYCAGDPINAYDPSGHSLVTEILFGVIGIAMGVIGILGAVFSGGTSLAITFAVIGGFLGIVSSSLSIAGSVEGAEGNEGTANILNKVSLGIGVLSAIFSLGSSLSDAAETLQARKLFKVAVKGKSFFKLTTENDGLGVLKKSRVPSPKIWKSVEDYTVREIKISPDGKISIREEGAGVYRQKKIGKAVLTFTKSARFPRSQFINGETLRSIPNTLYETGNARNIAIKLMSTGYSIYKVVTKWNNYENKNKGSEPGVDAGIISAYGIPSNKSIDSDSDSSDDDGDFY